MGKIRLGARLAAGCVVAWGGAATAWAAPTVPQMLQYRPRQDVVPMTTPAEAEFAACKVELVNGPGSASGWMLRDAHGQLVRKFVATKGAKATIDVWSYYQDGQETYREIDSNGNGKPDQFRWYGPGGMRWGVDVNEDGQIDGWKQISAEEVSQEILRAFATKNVGRLQALVLSEQELKALELPAPETTRLRESIAKIPAKFQDTAAKVPLLTDAAKWQHLETPAPQCVPAEAAGGKYDLIRYRTGTILYETGGKHDWLQTGEMVQVGRAWRLVGAPTPGHAAPDGPVAGGGGDTVELSEEIKPLIAKLQDIDKGATQAAQSPAATVKYNLERAAVLEQIAGRVKADQAEQWLRQVADCYSAAAQNSGPGDAAPYARLVELRDRVAKAQPGSPLAGYITFREMSADYANKLAKPDKNADLTKIQDAWRERLKKFVDEYPSAEDAPDALLQLGMVSEFINKETEAKNYYDLLARNYAKHPLAAKAQGAAAAELDGQVMELAGPVLGTGQPFDIAKLRGKTVVVYYWASWNQQCAADFFKLKTLVNTYGSKGLEVVCVNLDNSQAEAIGYLQRTPTPGTHLYQQPGGLDSPLAAQYGVMVLPNLFLVGPTGKVVSHTVQMNGLEDEIKKLMDK